ncbi:MAG TPA: VOC family protein [Ktedonobacterales bacterium]|nr:VOC family protein [Ktedonobacterales bacterium]
MSTIHIGPYINFQGRAREAMEFYHHLLGGTLVLNAVNKQGISQPAGPGDRIAHAQLDADGVHIFASDGHPDYPAAIGEHMAIALGGTDKDRLTTIFNDLAEGGKTKMPLIKQPSGAEVGWLTDKFGINWMVTIEKA